ncbi:NAD(P)H-dependent oxidoreductase [Nitrosomonas sp.]|uniref:NAD(P)H-dependent oxidoreductase n=1 Tax=Nitrosomonas sp. TaxID=42353 RepID=UPI002083923B|nr:NAD(P)H-dependent oxidoreductase [Nitrosomonas sp.]GJL76914.1 MAG: dehydrogenase [Nitrosomonas sp.]
MTGRITIIQGHPDGQARHFCHVLAEEYITGAKKERHEVCSIDVAKIDFPLLRTQQDFENAAPSDAIRQAQQAIGWANHLVIIYPLWLGSMPALLKAFFEQTLRPNFAFEYNDSGHMPKKRLTGRSARIVVTMGMPAFIYRWFYFAHGLKNLERNILGFSGIGPIKATLIGSIENMSEGRRTKWLNKVRKFGECGI